MGCRRILWQIPAHAQLFRAQQSQQHLVGCAGIFGVIFHAFALEPLGIVGFAVGLVLFLAHVDDREAEYRQPAVALPISGEGWAVAVAGFGEAGAFRCWRVWIGVG